MKALRNPLGPSQEIKRKRGARKPKAIPLHTKAKLNPRTSPTLSKSLLGGSWDLVSKDISTLIGVISSYRYSYPNYNPSLLSPMNLQVTPKPAKRLRLSATAMPPYFPCCPRKEMDVPKFCAFMIDYGKTQKLQTSQSKP